jgi:ATP-dependent Clp protease ATP-binding subunit ClpB
MTSNIGSEKILEAGAEGNFDFIKSSLLENLRQHMRPELINRIDDVIVYRPLDKVLLRKVVDIQLDSLNKILNERKLRVELEDNAKDYLAELGFDPVFGARPLKRTIYKQIQVPLSKKLLAGEFYDGDIVEVSLGQGAGDRQLVMKSRPMA